MIKNLNFKNFKFIKPAIFPFVLLLLVACHAKEKHRRSPMSQQQGNEKKGAENTLFKISGIAQLNQDSCSIHWYGGGIFSLCFEKNKVYYFFNAQCIYWYPSELRDNKIVFTWAFNENCTFHRGLKTNYGLKAQPVKGKPFGEFSLLNDSTLRATYYYPDWVRIVNSKATDVDTLFPTIFKQKPH